MGFFYRLGELISKLPGFVAVFHTSIIITFVVLVVQDLFQNPKIVTNQLPWHVATIIVIELTWITLLAAIVVSSVVDIRRIRKPWRDVISGIIALAIVLLTIIVSSCLLTCAISWKWLCATPPQPPGSLMLVSGLIIAQIASIFIATLCEKSPNLPPQLIDACY